MRSVFILVFSLTTSYAQVRNDSISNSFKKYFLDNGLTINYMYIDSTQTHNYAGNWDFDGDGKHDSLLFIGNRGAHLYFYLQLVLSSDKKQYQFPYLLVDFPLVSTKEGLIQNELLTQFAVDDFDNDGLPEIFINTDNGMANIPDIWKQKGIKSKKILMSFNKGNLSIRNYNKQTQRK
jgi:hypothetical protein